MRSKESLSKSNIKSSKIRMRFMESIKSSNIMRFNETFKSSNESSKEFIDSNNRMRSDSKYED